MLSKKRIMTLVAVIALSVGILSGCSSIDNASGGAGSQKETTVDKDAEKKTEESKPMEVEEETEIELEEGQSSGGM